MAAAAEREPSPIRSEPATPLLFLQFPFEDNMFNSLFYPIQSKFLDTVNTLCGRIPQVFLKQIEKTLRKVFEEKVVRHVRLHK